ncbi:unnamed protein product [Symbiodinium sp. CCMP2592]|nr:unnamed protein product [Symbiodinium sp. CCMP2592]
MTWQAHALESMTARPLMGMRLASPWLARRAHAVVVLSTFMLGETTLSGNCQIELPYTMRASEKSTCHAALSSVQAAITATAVFAQIQTNYTFINTLKDSLKEPELVLPLPKAAILQGFAVHGHGNGLTGDVVLKSDVILPAKCPSGDSFSFYQAALQGSRYRVPLASHIQSMEPGATVVLQIDYVMQLKTKQKPGFGHAFALQVPLPPGTNKDTRSLSGPAVSIEVLGESLELEVDVAATTPGVVVKRCPTGISNCHMVESPVLQDVALEIAMPTRGQTQANLHSPLSPFLTLQKHPATGQVAAALWLPPALDLGEGSMFEVFMVVDASATMHGPRLGRVQQALRALLRSLPRGIRMNIIGHDAKKPLEPMFQESQEVDEKIFQEVDQHLAREPATSAALSASGPQSVEAVLGAIFDSARPASTQLRVLLITDRHPPDSKKAIQLVEESCSEDCRLFSTGLGWSASPMFVEDVAKAGGGSFSYVAERDFKLGLEKALLSHLLDGLVPVIRAVNVSWGSLLGTSLQLSLDLSEMDFNSRLLSIALINPSIDEPDLDLSKLKQLDIQAVVGGVHRSMAALQLGMSTSTALHAAGVSLYAEDTRESPQTLPENVQDAAVTHRVATSATQWVFKPSQAQQAVLCEGLPSSTVASASASDTSSQRGTVPSDKDRQESIHHNLLSTRERQQAPLKQLGEKLSALDFGRFALSLSLKDDAVNQRYKPSGKDSEKPSERMDDWFRPRASMFSVRGFSRAGSALSLLPGGSVSSYPTGNKHASSTWPGDVSDETWPFRHGRDKDFLAGPGHDVERGSKKGAASSGPELVTRNTPSGRAKKAAGVVSRLSVLDFSLLGQRLSLQGSEGSRAQRSFHSRLESLSLFDSMMAGSGGTAASTGRKDAFKSRSQALSLRSHIAISEIGASPSKHLPSWAKLSATGVFTLASQLSIRRPEKIFGRSRGFGNPSYASFADLSGQDSGGQAGQAANERGDEAGGQWGQFLSDSSLPAGAAEKEAEQPSALPALHGWISIEVAGGILQGVCPVRYASEACSDESEQVAIHWRPGRNASSQMAQVYLTTAPLTSSSQAVRLGEASFPSASESSEILIGVQVSKTCELTVRSVQAGKHLDKLMTANLVAAAPQQFQGAPLQSPQPLELTSSIGEALVNRLGAVRRGFPTMIRSVAKAKADHASYGAAGSAAELAACHAFLFAQSFQGYFALEQAALQTIGLSWDHLQLLASSWTSSTPDGAKVAHTTFALNVLTESFQEMQASWYLAANRAEAWLKQQVAGLSLPGCRNLVSCFETARIFAVRERQEKEPGALPQAAWRPTAALRDMALRLSQGSSLIVARVMKAPSQWATRWFCECMLDQLHALAMTCLCGFPVGRATPDHASSRQNATWQVAEAGLYFTSVQNKRYEQARQNVNTVEIEGKEMSQMFETFLSPEEADTPFDVRQATSETVSVKFDKRPYGIVRWQPGKDFKGAMVKDVAHGVFVGDPLGQARAKGIKPGMVVKSIAGQDVMNEEFDVIMKKLGDEALGYNMFGVKFPLEAKALHVAAAARSADIRGSVVSGAKEQIASGGLKGVHLGGGNTLKNTSPYAHLVALERYYLPKLVENGAAHPVIDRVIQAAQVPRDRRSHRSKHRPGGISHASSLPSIPRAPSAAHASMSASRSASSRQQSLYGIAWHCMSWSRAQAERKTATSHPCPATRRRVSGAVHRRPSGPMGSCGAALRKSRPTCPVSSL